jgi:uncharacterized protein YkwD
MKKSQTITLSIVMFLVTLGLSTLVGYFLVTHPAQPTPTPAPQPAVVDLDAMWHRVNDERAKANLKPLDRATALDRSAAAKCADMQTNNYWAHVSPTGVQYYSFIKQETPYRIAGENLSKGYDTTDKVVNAWMLSTGHRD